MSTKPGITYMPLPSISKSASRGSRLACCGSPGQPAWRTEVMLVAFDDDVHRAERRTAGAVDQRDAADHHLLERPGAVALLARRRGAVAGVAAAACRGAWAGGRRGACASEVSL